MKKFIIIFTLLILSQSCSKDDQVNTTPDEEIVVELNLSLRSINSYSSSLQYSYNSQLENVKLIYDYDSDVDTNNYLEKIDISTNNASTTINNLKPNRDYVFKLVAEIDGEAYYSDAVSTRTSEIPTLFNGEIASSITTSSIEEVLKTDDGYIIVTGYGELFVHKIDNDFNLVWSKEIVERDTNNFKSIIDLENGEYIIFGSGPGITNVGTYNTKSFAIKIDNSGNTLWTKYYHYADNTDISFWWNDIVRFKRNGSDLKLLTTVDTTYSDATNKFYHEYTLDFNGDIISQQTLPDSNDQFLNIVYDDEGNIYNYGSPYFNSNYNSTIGLIEKYNQNHELIWSEHYNTEINGDDTLNQVLVDQNYVVTIGKESDSYDKYRLVQFRNNQGDLLWEFKEPGNCDYEGYDIISESDDNFIVLFLDRCSLSNKATLINFDTEGNIIWRYLHNGGYTPHKILHNNGEYHIFGVKEFKLWVKNIIID
ncbi:hypothetical protein [Winogradskyella rapida]|uniref:Fibronectin type-III domain-containing protein n=1 Tax=Winogradskyella rapida TaxID=549701 RepID=A0ABW3KNB8_9FLAO